MLRLLLCHILFEHCFQRRLYLLDVLLRRSLV
jgi:hypothetical protein